MENWCWEPEALAFLSGHYETGEPLPQAELSRLLEAKNFQSAMQMLRQLEFSLFDFRLHHEFDPALGARVQSILERCALRSRSSCRRSSTLPAQLLSYLCGGYAAGYYSYKWAEVLSADAFSRFEEEGIFNSRTGSDFMQQILEQGGSRSPMELFRAFRGREPKIDALLRHCGIQG